MLVSIHNRGLTRVGFMDNEKPATLHFYNDTWHRYLAEATSTFDFTVSKRRKNDLLQYLTEENYISFRHDGHDFLFNIMKIVESETEIQCYTENLNLELLNETDAAHDEDGAKTFEAYLTLCGITNAQLTVGVNEISDRTRTLSWDGTATKLERLLSIASQFDAEIEFETLLCNDGTLDSIVLNVYKESDDSNQGVGNYRPDKTLYYGKTIKGVTRTVDKTEMYTAIRPHGKDNLTISAVDKTETADGMTFTTTSGSDTLCCPEMRDKYPSQLIDSSAESYIVLDWDYDTDSADTLYSKALAKLKSVCSPAITYEASGKFELEIGDTITIQDEAFNPILILEARVSEQQISFSDPTQNLNTYANFRAIKSRALNTTVKNDGTVHVKSNGKVTNDKVVFQKDGLYIENADGTSSNLALWLFPVGYVFMSYSADNPGDRFGGTWTLDAKGRVYIGAGGDYAVGATGGEATHTLTTAEMPSHSHQQYVTTGTGTDAPRSDYNEDGTFSKYPQCSTGSTGGGGAHNNMMPYKAVYYWRRTA